MRTKSEPNRELIRKLLTRDGERITYGEIARGTRSHVTHIVKVFNGKRGLSVEMMGRVAAYLGCSMEKLKTALGR